tara:strand:- start:1417 stop:1518 length:102 start_codon:yes stop_codon:yes gene_type:complete
MGGSEIAYTMALLDTAANLALGCAAVAYVIRGK